ncbi:tetratricopeptide repeat protein [Pseudoroseomonas cervicalis]|uniref:tetratricopeptide repeat protein n=1 Tax=Teichococcus cervicalis TaxID=204525 RepID=UPI0022F15EBC|nr:tetratricopeptide repeat protein [Pseudoroseomonas cervicalis]WBV43670.1 tetratricopeptide repeat protein [Pseudoroseomonas cervicalis]
MPDIFDEVQEELRAERARRLALRYGGLATGAVLLVLAGLGGWQGWRWYQQREAAQSAAVFLEQHRAAEAQGADLRAIGDRFAGLAASSPEGYRILATLRAAALKAETGDRDGALALWNQLSADNAAPRIYRDLASLMWALHGIDSQDPGQLAARLGPLAAEGSAWRASARELQGLLALRQGDKATAKREFEALAQDVTAPQGLRDRAGRLAAGLGV